MKNHVFIGLLIALGVWLSTSSILISADEHNGETSDDDYACAQHMLDNAPDLIDNYETFLNELFQVDQPSSEQVESAMTFYRYVETTLNNMFEVANSFDVVKSIDSASSEVAYCTYIRDQYIDYARLLLNQQVLGSGSSKRTFQVVDGLKAINEGLEEFVLDFVGTFPTMFNKMNNALPCYASQCILK